MRNFLKIIFFILAVSPILVKAQVTTQQEYNGRYTASKDATGQYSGSPYLFDEWKKANIKFPNQTTEQILAKYNLLDDALYIAGKNGEPMPYGKAFDEVTIEDNKGNTLLFKYILVGNEDPMLCQILFDDKIQLFKKERASFIEVLEYNEASAKKKVIKKTIYYSQFKGRRLSELKISKKSLLELMADKKSAIEVFLKKENIDLKDDKSLAKVFEYYNSLI